VVGLARVVVLERVVVVLEASVVVVVDEDVVVVVSEVVVVVLELASEVVALLEASEVVDDELDDVDELVSTIARRNLAPQTWPTGTASVRVSFK
jgi:hypothetical protein